MGKSINVQNYYMAKITEENGAITHGVPKKIFGLMKANRVPQAASTEMYEEGVQSEQIDRLIAHNLAFDFGDLPTDWRAYIQGYNYVNGVLNDEGECKPNPFAVGWEVVRADGTKQLMWYLYCQAKPIEENDEQKTKDIKISNDTINCVALKKEKFKFRGFTLIDTKNEDITEQMVADFFTQVQTTDDIGKPAEEPEEETQG